MRKLIVTEFISVDGVIDSPGPQGPYKHAGWTFDYDDPERMKYRLDEVMESSALLLGRVTYEGFAAAWPGRTDMVGFAGKMNSMPKYVVSTTLTDPAWENTTVIADNVPERVAKLKQADGGAILVNGSAMLVGTLVEHDLVDEYRLMTFPVVLGCGKRLFGERDELSRLKLVDVQRYDSGTLTLIYERAA